MLYSCDIFRIQSHHLNWGLDQSAMSRGKTYTSNSYIIHALATLPPYPRRVTPFILEQLKRSAVARHRRYTCTVVARLDILVTHATNTSCILSTILSTFARPCTAYRQRQGVQYVALRKPRLAAATAQTKSGPLYPDVSEQQRIVCID